MQDFGLDFHSIARDWYVALSPTAFRPSKYDETIKKLAALVQGATSLRFGDEYQAADAEQIGATLADLHYIQGDAIGLSMKVLANTWLHNMPAAMQEKDPERLATLFGDIANGYFKTATNTILHHQEMMREAQLSTTSDLYADLQRQKDHLSLTAERLQTLLDIESGILAAQTAEAIADVAITHIMRIIPCFLAILVTIDLQQDVFIVLASENTPEKTGDHIPLSFTTDERLKVLANSNSFIINDIDALKNPEPGLEHVRSRGVKSVINVPLITMGNLIGLLSLCSKEVNYFTDHHEEVIRQIADSVAVALHNRQLLETEQKARLESETLREVAASLSSNLEQKELLDNILLQLETLLPYDGAVIQLQTEGKSQVVAQRGFQLVEIELLNNLDQLPPNIQKLVVGKKPVIVPNTELDPEWIELIDSARVRSWLGAPLIYQGNLTGFLAIDKHEPDFYQPSDAELVLTFANHAAVAIENARLFNEVQQSTNFLRDRVAARTRDLESLYEIAAITSQPLDLPIILKAGLHRILVDLACQSGTIHVLDKDSGIFNLVEFTNLSSYHMDQIQQIDINNSLLHEILEDQMPIVITDPKSAFLLLEELIPFSDACLVIAPMRARGEIQGLLSLYCEGDHDFTADDIKLASSIADHMGTAIDNANLQAQSEKAAVLEERERLARDLHDSATQSLFSLALFAAAAREKVRSGQLEIALQHLADIGYTANQTHRDMRLLLYQLGSSKLLEEGLVTALEWRLQTVEGRSGINATFHPQHTANLHDEVEQALYQIANEALNNVLKHAGGTNVTVELIGDDSQMTLIVKDNGNGFDLVEANKGAGMGLKNMRLRASRMGGVLSILTSIGEGTEIIARIPRDGFNQRSQ